MGRILTGVVAAAIAGAIWWLWPVYGFLSHSGNAPMLPFGWIEMPEEVPVSESVFDARFEEAGQQALDALATHRAKINAPSMTAAVAINGELVWQGAAGFADIAASRAANADMILRVGSTSKAITATALARMVQRGEIDLDASISIYLDELPNDDWALITPRMLASHMAGLPHYENNDDTDGLLVSMRLNKSYDDIRDSLHQFDESSLRYRPGEDFEYSSNGTVLLGAVMSEASGKSYRKLIEDEVLVPANASSTIAAPKHMRGDEFAVPYFTKSGDHRRWRPVDLSHRLPAGGWASSASDLVKIGSLWLDDDFISPDTRTLFWEPQTLANGNTNEQDYALGWRWREWTVDGDLQARNANHGGVSRGGQCWLLVYPDYDMVIAYNMNGRTEDFAPFSEFHDNIFAPFARALRNSRDTD